MSQLTYLQLVNRVIARVPNTAITDVTAATGNALLASQYLNEAQNYFFTIDNWYSLYASRTFSTTAAQALYPVAADFGRSISLNDMTNMRIYLEDYSKSFDEVDPGALASAIPQFFNVEGANYRMWPIPAGVYSITDRYWKIPATLAVNSDTSALPIECENPLIYFAQYKLLTFLNKTEAAALAKADCDEYLKAAMSANKKRIDRMRIMTSTRNRTSALAPPRLPGHYPTQY